MRTHLRQIGVGLLIAALAATCVPLTLAAGGNGHGHGEGGGGNGGFHVGVGGAGSGFHIGGGGGSWSGGGATFHGGTGASIHREGSNWSGAGVHLQHGLPGGLQFHSNSIPGIHAGNWDHGWSHHVGSWNHENNWWHDHGHNWNGWWGVGIGWPGGGIGWWPGYYNYYDYGYSAPYYTGAYADYSPEAVPYTAAYPPADTTTAAAATETSAEDDSFYAQALAAFQQGDFRNATRLAGHASVDDPRNPNVHTLLMLGLFALGEYRGSAMEAHAVTTLGKVPDWAAVYAFYGSVDPYTEHLRKLEKSVRDNPGAAEGRFLLGFQYLMANHKDAAQNEFLQALKLTPKDRLAAQLLKQSGGTVPADLAKQLATPPAPQTPPAPNNPNQGKK